MAEFTFKDSDPYSENTGVVGEHYGGKTYFVGQNILKPMLKTRIINVWAWDHQAKWKDYFEPHQVVYYLDDLQRGTQCYVPENKSEEHFDEFCELVQQLNNTHLFIDESHNYHNAQRMAKQLQPVIRDLSGNQNVAYTLVWQRASEGHKSVMSNARHKFLFNFDSLDQDRYLQMFGKYADLFLNPEERKYFRDFTENNKKYRYDILTDYSFLYRDEKNRTKVEIYNGGHLTTLESLKIEI